MNEKKEIKKPKKDIQLKVYFNETNKKKGYEGYKKSDLKNMWLHMSKSAKLYGDTQQANKYEKWANITLNEHWKNGDGAKIRRMVKITSNSNQLLPNTYGKDEGGMFINYNTPKAPRDNVKFKQFREARLDAIKTLKVFPTLNIYTQNWIIDNGDEFLRDKTPEEVNIILSIAEKVGGYNSAVSKYQGAIDRLLRGGEISQFEMMILVGLKGIETKPANSASTLKKKNS